jgi:hypothetical protein
MPIDNPNPARSTNCPRHFEFRTLDQTIPVGLAVALMKPIFSSRSEKNLLFE